MRLTRYLTECLGTLLLLAIVTGSGHMGQTLSDGNDAVALLGNSIATGAGLFVLIGLLGPVSGAHFNPVVSLMFWWVRALSTRDLLAYVVVQCLGAVLGVWLVHVLFDLPILQLSQKARAGLPMMVSEWVSTLVLLTVIWLGVRQRNDRVPLYVALTVTAGYWFTSSTFFANPAVTLARSLTDTFVGISWTDVPGFWLGQLAALLFIGLVLRHRTSDN
jgi:glycerol uptake facilitator-like aquaporin